MVLYRPNENKVTLWHGSNNNNNNSNNNDSNNSSNGNNSWLNPYFVVNQYRNGNNSQKCPMCGQNLFHNGRASTTVNDNDNNIKMSDDYFMILDRAHYNNNNNNTNNDNNNININNGNKYNLLNNNYYKNFFVEIKKLGSGSYGAVFLVEHKFDWVSLGLFATKNNTNR